VSNDEDFAALFEASLKARQFSRGQTIEGTVVAVGPKVALVEVGGKGEAEIDVEELKDVNGALEVAVGDRIQARIVSTSGGIVLSRKGVRHAATQHEIEEAFRAGLPIEGKVVQEIKGGYEVRIARERAFCPLSQIDIARTTEPAVHVGQVYAFLVTEYSDNGKNIVVSRRKHLEEQQHAKAEELRKAIVPGAVLTGRVVSVRDFGAFVDLGGGILGLLHVSEMGWSRVTSPNAIVAAGDQITVKVLRVDEATQKISLGMKELLADPWSTVATTYQIGQMVSGRVSRVAQFGVFVELAPGIDGLIPLSETGLGQDADLKRIFTAGTPIDVVILEIDAASRRMRLSSRAVASAQEADEVREYTERQDASPSASVGSLADKLRGALGKKN
jgi:small subunit ribosomal protein S1